LQLARHDGAVDMPEYLGGLCESLAETLRDLRPVTISAGVDPISLPPEKALSIGLIVNELVTNAFKYAFPNGPGHILVGLTKNGPGLELSVTDDGIGCGNRTDTGLGTKLVTLLAAQLGGSAKWEQTHPGCKVSAAIPAP
jgi:two-component sensor histidine kinase